MRKTERPITDINWHQAPITSIQFQPREECVLAVSSDDGKLSLWDFSVESDQQDTSPEFPPQLMFLHSGQSHIKELRFHPQFDSVIFTTAEDSFNVLKPNLDPEVENESDDEEKEMKEVHK